VKGSKEQGIKSKKPTRKANYRAGTMIIITINKLFGLFLNYADTIIKNKKNEMTTKQVQQLFVHVKIVI